MLSAKNIAKIKKRLKKEDESLYSTFAVLGDKNRYRIMELVALQKKLCVSDIASILGISLSCVSQHLRILEISGLVEGVRCGQTICYGTAKHRQKIKSVLKLI